MSKFLFIFLFLSTVAESSVKYKIDMNISNENIEANRFNFNAEITNDQDSEYCLYIPFNNPLFNTNQIRGVNPSANDELVNMMSMGGLDITFKPEGVVTINPFLYKIKNRRKLVFSVEFTIPKKQEWNRQINFSDFHPQIILDCSEATKVANNVDVVDFAVKINNTSDYKPVSSALHNEEYYKIRARKFPLFLIKEMQSHTFTQNGIDVELYFDNPLMENVLLKSKILIPRHLEKFKNWPYPKLVILQTSILEKPFIPGIITMNLPRQTPMQRIQLEYLNWGTWQLSYLLAEQIWGADISYSNINDIWFFQGLAEYISHRSLYYDPELKDLINVKFFGRRPFSMTNIEVENLITGVMIRSDRDNPLIDRNFRTLLNNSDRYSFNYLRNTMATRYIAWYLGHDKFNAFLKFFQEKYSFKNIEPQIFVEEMRDWKDSIEWFYAAEYLTKWWGSKEWPDFSLGDVITTAGANGGYQSTVYVNTTDSYSVPVDIYLETWSGDSYLKRAEYEDGLWKVDFDLKSRPRRIVINPNEEIYDMNRFNNDNSVFPKVNFIPGFNNSFDDDAYTVLWVPGIMKLPGENWKIILGTGVLKYIESSYLLMGVYHLEREAFGYSFAHSSYLEKSQLNLNLSIAQDFDVSTEGLRISSLAFNRNSILIRPFILNARLQFNSRNFLGETEFNHGGVLAGLFLRKDFKNSCSIRISGGGEFSIPYSSKGPDYQKYSETMNFSCATNIVGFNLRQFWGKIDEDKSRNTLPGGVLLFPQDLSGARIRIDSPTLKSRYNIQSYGVELISRLNLSFLPSSFFILPSRARFKAFYDYSPPEDGEESIMDAGLSLYLPFGGDVVGKESVSLTRISVALVLYRKYEDVSEFKPGLLLDLTGNI